MQNRGFLSLVAATVVLVGVAIYALASGDRGNAPPPAGGERALPGLDQKLGDLAWIRLTRGAMKANFAAIGGRWVLVEKGNYPADAGKLRQLLLGLADLTLLEPKTERPHLLARLDLDDPSNERAALVTLQDRTGQNVGELLIGKRRADRLGGGAEAVYVRRPNTDRAWLARGAVNVSGDLVQWLDRRIIDLPVARVASVKLTGADGSSVTLSRASAADQFMVANPPPDTKFKGPAALAAPASALTALDLTDVKPAADQPPPDSAVDGAVVTTFDGLTVELRLFSRDNVDWLVLDAAGKDAAGDEAKAISARVARWSYAIPADRAKALRTRLPDLIEPEKPS